MSVAFLRALVATLVFVWQLADGRFFVTADSRSVFTKDGKSVVSDDTCKLFPVGRIVFFDTGSQKGTFGNATIFNGQTIGVGLLQEHRRDAVTKENIDSLADTWARRLKADIDLYRQIPTVDRNFGGTTGVFLASLTDGTTYSAVRSVDPEEPGGQFLITPKPLIGYLAVGEGAAVAFAKKKFDDDIQQHVLEDNPAQMLFQVETDTINKLQSTVAGGPVDELVLRPNQDAEWIHKKSNCQ